MPKTDSPKVTQADRRVADLMLLAKDNYKRRCEIAARHRLASAGGSDDQLRELLREASSRLAEWCRGPVRTALHRDNSRKTLTRIDAALSSSPSPDDSTDDDVVEGYASEVVEAMHDLVAESLKGKPSRDFIEGISNRIRGIIHEALSRRSPVANEVAPAAVEGGEGRTYRDGFVAGLRKVRQDYILTPRAKQPDKGEG